ncbi:uncharacterized protein PV06_11686 [Exophiala oligosperma]|uniref:FAD-binding PCMH-type domain-containing protein n=1 Tax=Exophiala oligosperma TaxID=215243 RepID=A0A0D2A6T9_9EURO|nr:uncharacterized protein PV06_11686 [Exophiala oligosperma]KIW36011.1 hypothetical protein PV06_11686 [Exophiala oligosperma]
MEKLTSKRVLPAGFDEKTFDQALDALSLVVGADNVSRDGSHGSVEGPNGEKSYGDIWPLANPTDHTPSGAVRPATVEDVQGVLKVANRYRLPLWTVSRGRNLGYGGSGAVVRGTVVLDLQRMNKIIEVNEELAYAIVEPGVSFFDLYNYIQERGYRLWPSCPALGWGSIVGNTLDRGFGYTPEGEHSQQQCGMELVLPSGEVVRTGMGAFTGSPMWPLYKGGYGPSVDGLFYQSNLGIVTKLGIHITPAPVCFMDCEISVPHESQLGLLIKTVGTLEREGVVQNHTSIANPYHKDALQRVFGPGMQGSCASNRDLTLLAHEAGLGYWKASFAIYGFSPIVLDAQWSIVQERFGALPGAICTCQRYENKDGGRRDASKLPLAEIPHAGTLNIVAKELMNVRGPGGGHICFSPLFSSDGMELQEWWTRARDIVENAQFDVFSDFHVYGRYVIAILLVVYGPNEGPRARVMFEQLLEDGRENAGVSEYRAHIDYMDEVRSHFNFNNGALNRLVDTIKNTLDPNGILSQGKSGIWTYLKKPNLQRAGPKSLRHCTSNTPSKKSEEFP